MAEDLCDLARLIRSIQRLEGNPDCFGTARDSCEQTLCAWREYCLKPQGESDSSKAALQKGVSWKSPGAETDRLGAELLRRVNARRRVFLSSTRIHDRYVLRICVLSFRTHADRVKDAVEALRREARALLG